MSLPQSTGTAAVVVQVTGTNWPKPLYTLLVTGLCRFRVDKLVQQEPFVVAEVTQLDATSELGWYSKRLKYFHIYFACIDPFRHKQNGQQIKSEHPEKTQSSKIRLRSINLSQSNFSCLISKDSTHQVQ